MPYTRRNKYSVAPKADRTHDGILYASKLEMSRAITLQTMLRAGVALHVIEQPLVRLGCAENKYRPDFFVVWSDGLAMYEDVKGVETQAFRRNVKLWAKYGPAPLRILTRVGNGWKIKTIEGRRHDN